MAALWLFALTSAVVCVAPRTQAGSCTASGTDYVCSGDFTQGFTVPNDSSVVSVFVNNLTGDIAPTGTSGTASGTGIFWAPDQEINTGSFITLEDSHSIIIDAAKYGDLVGHVGAFISGTKGFFNTMGVELHVRMPVTVIDTQQPAVLVQALGPKSSSSQQAIGIGPALVYGPATITTSGASAPGLNVALVGGNGSQPDYDVFNGETGSAGASSGKITIYSGLSNSEPVPWAINTAGNNSPGVTLLTQAGSGGQGGEGDESGGEGGAAGSAGAIIVGDEQGSGKFPISTVGTNSGAILAQTLGGNGGSGTDGGTGNGGAGREGTQGGSVEIDLAGSTLTTNGSGSPGIFALSAGGNGGNGGAAGADPGATGGDGGVGQGGGNITISLTGQNTIHTVGDNSDAIAAHSIGGQGGKSGSGTFWGKAGNGGLTGNSGTIDIAVAGTITTEGYNSKGIIAQSVAGHGGNTGHDDGVVAFSAAAGSAGAGGAVSVTNAAGITTSGNVATAIQAQSIGGGGGSGGSNFGVFYAKGSSGGAGGDGGTVTVTNSGSLTASGNAAPGIVAQSIGGGGGSGGSAGGLGAVGASGGDSSNGGVVTVTNTGRHPDRVQRQRNVIQRSGRLCPGLFRRHPGPVDRRRWWVGRFRRWLVRLWRHRIGRQATAIPSPSRTITRRSPPRRRCHQASWCSRSVAVAAMAAAPRRRARNSARRSAAAGGNGGNGGSAQLYANGALSISTGSDNSQGLMAQSIGGGGGAGGYAVDAAVGAGEPAVSLAVGGSAGNGGAGGPVVLSAGLLLNTGASANATSANNSVSTIGDNSPGLVAQSIGGGGGHGGIAISVGVSNVGSLSIGIGGSGGKGGNGGTVTLSDNTGISTLGAYADAIQAQSIGGGGGNGGAAVSISLSTIGGAVGRRGRYPAKPRGTGDTVQVTSESGLPISTAGDFSYGVLAQSVGGGGGKGGTSIAGSLTITASDAPSGAFGFSLGGAGGAGGASNTVDVTVDNPVSTRGDHAGGIVAQSLAGGGGAGGLAAAVSADITWQWQHGRDRVRHGRHRRKRRRERRGHQHRHGRCEHGGCVRQRRCGAIHRRRWREWRDGDRGNVVAVGLQVPGAVARRHQRLGRRCRER